ncbi:hypothetical protein Q8G28_09130 [Lysinibacillus capsici]|uniref:hypothetical protein n=1 Tax=Lysinibacillus capsici TaxID=2115968 RepID=UPI00272FD507|nr:hypothetical protein [Lysinibacillus capsici]MDP1393772.1 hypothetical protein [Lysinibacillus capsici]MDP1414029.1 hypothetical protein [Lysinibacillus capsici]MDP1429918.1 hypothetical protein [Lysinibacillus capsici]
MLASCNNYNSGTFFKGERDKWSGELITSYDFWGNERQSIRVQYKGEKLDELQENNFFVESPDFLGWGIGNIRLDNKGNYFSGDAVEQETKTPSSSKIYLIIEGVESEIITLSSTS